MLRETFTVETPLTLSDTEKIQTYHQHHSLMKKPTPGTPNTGNPVNADNRLRGQFQTIHLLLNHPTSPGEHQDEREDPQATWKTISESKEQ